MPIPNSEALLQQAFAMFQTGRLREAESMAAQIFGQEPKNFNAVRLLGLCQLQQNRLEAGIEFLAKAHKLKPRHGATLFELGQAATLLGRYGEALKYLDKAVQVEPTNAEAHHAKAIALRQSGRAKEALVSFQRATTLDPKHAQAQNNLGNELLALGRYEDALACFDKALVCQSGLALAHNGRASALVRLDRYQEALASYDRAIALAPDLAHAHNGRGLALHRMHRDEEALASIERAGELDPGNVDVWRNKGLCLLAMDRHEAAEEAFRQAIALDGRDAELYKERGKALARAHRYGDALASLGQGLVLRPDDNVMLKQSADALLDLGRLDETVAVYEDMVRRCPDDPGILSGWLGIMNYATTSTAYEMAERHRHFGRILAARSSAAQRPHANTPDPDKRLRIGFVSADLRSHPVGLFMESVFKGLSAHGLELHAYANQAWDDALTERIRPYFAEWRDIHEVADAEADALIRADGVDILVDLSGHTTDNRLPLFARKPAPVQVTYLGYSGTTGLTTIDYILGTRWLMPEDEAGLYTETPYRLPDTQLCFTPPALDIPVGEMPALAGGTITFGNFNNLYKMNDATVACWARVLDAVPGSRLLIKAKQFGGDDARDSVLARFSAHGISAERLILVGAVSYEEHFRTYQQVDIALDPFPYNGTTTTMDALWMGVPVLTMQGDRYLNRVGPGIMQVMGMPEWIACDTDDYVARAAAFAAEPAALQAIRTGLRERLLASPLCDAPRFSAHLAQAFRVMWQGWCGRQTLGQG